MQTILGIKKGMTRLYDGDKSVPVTIIDTSSCVVAYSGSDGLELGLGDKQANKAMRGRYKELRYVPRYRVWQRGEFKNVKVGDELTPKEFSPGDSILVKGVSKGKGFEGVVKRWGFAGGPKTHGQRDTLRSPGSIGAGTDPGRVFKGKKMPGRMGGENMTIKNKRIIAIEGEYIMVSGSVPGSKGSMVLIQVQEDNKNSKNKNKNKIEE